MAKELKKILIAEDDIHFREKLRRRFDERGIEVRCVRSGLALLYEFDDSYDAILADTEMPELTGPVACRILCYKISRNGTFIFAMSTNPDNRKFWHGITDYFYPKSEVESSDFVDRIKKTYSQSAETNGHL